MRNPYRFRKVGNLEIIEAPRDEKKMTVLLLHGFGADAEDLASFSELSQEVNWIFPQGPLLIPLSPHYTGRAWFPVDIPLLTDAVRQHRLDEIASAFPPELDEARKIIDQLIIDLSIPRSHLLIGGFSQGAILAVETALHGSERMGGLLIFSGTLINEVNWKQAAPRHAQTPFFQSHGTHDPLLPLSKAKDLTQLLQQGGLVGDLHLFHGGHDIPQLIIQHFSNFLKTTLG